MREAYLACLLAGSASLAMTADAVSAPIPRGTIGASPSAVTLVDYRWRRPHRSFGPRHYHRRAYVHSYYTGPRYYAAPPVYYAPPVVYYPPPVIYYPPPVVYGRYAPIAPYRYYGARATVGYYRGYNGW